MLKGSLEAKPKTTTGSDEGGTGAKFHGQRRLTVPCDFGYGCLTYVGLCFHLPKLERILLSIQYSLGGVMRNEVINAELVGIQEIGLNWVRNLRTSKFSLSSPLPLGSFFPNQLKLFKALQFYHMAGSPSLIPSLPEELASPAPLLRVAPRLAPGWGRWGGCCLQSCSSPSLQLLFLTGLSLIIGLRKTFSFFFQRHKLKGTSFFLGGVVIVLLRWPLLGMFLEIYGFFNLFK